MSLHVGFCNLITTKKYFEEVGPCFPRYRTPHFKKDFLYIVTVIKKMLNLKILTLVREACVGHTAEEKITSSGRAILKRI